MIVLNSGLTAEEARKVANPWSAKPAVPLDFAAAGVAAADFITRNAEAFLALDAAGATHKDSEISSLN